MSALRPHETGSPFFRLSPEMRLAVYNHLIPTGTIHIDLCTPRRSEQADFIRRKRSIISSLLMQTLNLEMISRENGLNLLLVSRRTNAEILPLLARTIVRFHCSKCFDELLRNFSHGLGVGVMWMKHIEILLDLTQVMTRGQTLTLEVGRTSAREVMALATKNAWLYYGRLDLSGREKWKYEPMPEKKTDEASESDEAAGGGMVPQQQQYMGAPPLPSANVGHSLHPQPQNRAGPPSKWLISAWFDI